MWSTVRFGSLMQSKHGALTCWVWVKNRVLHSGEKDFWTYVVNFEIKINKEYIVNKRIFKLRMIWNKSIMIINHDVIVRNTFEAFLQNNNFHKKSRLKKKKKLLRQLNNNVIFRFLEKQIMYWLYSYVLFLFPMSVDIFSDSKLRPKVTVSQSIDRKFHLLVTLEKSWTLRKTIIKMSKTLKYVINKIHIKLIFVI